MFGSREYWCKRCHQDCRCLGQGSTCVKGAINSGEVQVRGELVSSGLEMFRSGKYLCKRCTCTTVVLKRTAPRQMVMSLLESRRHPMTVFTMSLWTRNPTPCSCLSSYTEGNLVLPLLLFHQISSISFQRVQGCSICTYPFNVLVPDISPQLLVSLCSMCQWLCCLFHESSMMLQ